MQTILEKFDADPRFQRLARRKDNFRLMCEHILKSSEKGKSQILETGCAWDTDNWEHHGQSTLIWDWLIEQEPKVNCLSIDITPTSIESSKKQTKYVDLICSDSVVAINELDEEYFSCISLVYLDSYDWCPEKNLESSFHHLAELAACWRFLPSGCLIVVDDRHGDGQGKHWMVEHFLSDYLKIKPVFKNHQIGWLKP